MHLHLQKTTTALRCEKHYICKGERLPGDTPILSRICNGRWLPQEEGARAARPWSSSVSRGSRRRSCSVPWGYRRRSCCARFSEDLPPPDPESCTCSSGKEEKAEAHAHATTQGPHIGRPTVLPVPPPLPGPVTALANRGSGDLPAARES